MKRVWSKPELFSEEFQLDQHVALGCGLETIKVEKGDKIENATLTCWQTNGGGHWRFDELTINDSNNNGVIDYSEIADAATKAGASLTGQGHFTQHGIALEIPGKERVEVVPLNS